MSKQKIELGLHLQNLEKMQEILKSCEASAERIAALAPTIQQFHTGAVPGELASFSEDPGIYADLREAQWLLNDENHIANMMGLHWIKAIIKARCHAEGVPIAFNGKEEKELASKQNVGPVENKVEIRLDPAFPKSVFACDDKGNGAFLPASEVNISFESPSPELEEYIKGVSKGLDPARGMGKPVDMLMGRALNAEYVAELVETTGIDKETMQGILKRSFLCELEEVDFYTLIGAAITQGSVKKRLADMLVKIVNNPKGRKQWRQPAADMLAECGYGGKIMGDWQEPFQGGQVSTKMARDLAVAETKSQPSGVIVDSPLDYLNQEQVQKAIDAHERNVNAVRAMEEIEKTDKKTADAWLKVCALLDELRPGWINKEIGGVESALKTITTMAEKADFAEVKPDLYLTGFQWKDSQGAWQFALGPAGSAWYESQGFKTRFVYVTQKD